jgi:hypothetical protein
VIEETGDRHNKRIEKLASAGRADLKRHAVS